MEVCFGKNETRHRSEGLTKRGGRKGQDMKKWTGMITNLTMLTQFGLSLVTPLFLCLAPVSYTHLTLPTKRIV